MKCSNSAIERNVGAGQISCVRKKFAQNAPIPSPLRDGGFGVRLSRRYIDKTSPLSNFPAILIVDSLKSIILAWQK